MIDHHDRVAVRNDDRKVDASNEHHHLAADLSDDPKAAVKYDHRDHGTKVVRADPPDHVAGLNGGLKVDVFRDHRDHAADRMVEMKVCPTHALHAGHGDHR